jgi:hypothetical protein
LLAAAAPAAAPNGTATPPAQTPASGLSALAPSLGPAPAPNAVVLPTSADGLVRGYGTQAQQSLILAYFSAGTLADGLTAGSVTADEGKRQAETYLTLATNARDDVRHIRAAYVFERDDLLLLDQLAAGYGDVIPLIESTKKLAAAPTDAKARAAAQAAKRRAFLTLATIFGWK